MTADNIPDPHNDWERLVVDSLYLYAVFAISLDGTLLNWNPGVKAVLGYDEADFVGKSADMFFTPEDRATNVPERELEQATKHGNANDVRWHLRADGTRFWASGAMTALRNDAGELTGFAKVVRDNSESKSLEEALESINSSLETTVAERTADLRRLAGELTLAEQAERQALAKTLHDSVQQELYAMSFAVAKLRNEHDLDKAATQDLDELIKKTLKLTRDVTRNLKPEVLENDDLCEALKWLAHDMLERHGLSVKVTQAEGCTVKSAAVRTLVYTLVKEMLFNVVKHAGVREAALSVNLNEDLTIEVSDKGAGFDTDALNGSSGTGLGLKGARKRLALFGGKLKISSQADEGTQIVMSLPLATLAQPEPTTKPQEN